MALEIGISLIPVVIANGASLSAEVDTGAQTLVGIVMPAAWTAAALTFQVGVGGGAPWLEHYSAAGVETTFTVAAGQYIAVDPTLWRGVNAIKLRSGTAAAPVNQGQAATLLLVVKSLV